MDLSDPTRAVTPTLDGAVLAVLAASGKPLTVGQVAAQAARGSEIGIRRVLARLVEQGIVRATVMGRNQVHELNRDHVAAGIATSLANLRNELWNRLRAEFGNWPEPPAFAYVFGSAARGDGDDASDIDLLLVRLPSVASESWESQVDRLRGLVAGWTGNQLQVVEVSLSHWLGPPKSLRGFIAEVQREGIAL